MAEQVGTVDLLAVRIYPIDPKADVCDMDAPTAVEPGSYPVYQDGDTRYCLWSGRINERGIHPFGDGFFEVVAGDRPGDAEVRFPSRRWGPEEFAELLADPVCAEGPGQRLRFHFFDAHVEVS